MSGFCYRLTYNGFSYSLFFFLPVSCVLFGVGEFFDGNGFDVAVTYYLFFAV